MKLKGFTLNTYKTCIMKKTQVFQFMSNRDNFSKIISRSIIPYTFEGSLASVHLRGRSQLKLQYIFSTLVEMMAGRSVLAF